MKINHDNYEAYFLDFVEGKLSGNLLEELKLFLENNPLLKKELDNYSEIPLFHEEIVYPNKENLYKLDFIHTPITAENYANYCIALNENILDEEKKNELFTFQKQNKKFEAEFLLFSKVYLKPDNSLTFPNKTQLYKKGIVYTLPIKKIVLWGSVAASFAIGVFFWFSSNNADTQISQKANFQQTLPKQSIIDNTTSPALVMDNVNKPMIKNKVKKTVIPMEDSNRVAIIDSNEPKLMPLVAVSIKAIERKEDILTFVDLNRINTLDTVTQQEIFQNNQLATAYETEEARKKGLLAIAESGINKLNQLTGSNFELSRKTDPTGKVNTFSLNTGIFGFYRKRNRVE